MSSPLYFSRSPLQVTGRHAASVGVIIAASLVPVLAQCPSSEWVDPDTPSEVCQGKTDSMGHLVELVFSDEFNVPGRSFRDGEDPVWTAINGFPKSNAQVNAYHDSVKYATTKDGMLRLLVDTAPTNMQFSEDGETHNLQRAYTTPMLQTWNKFCYTEGVLEMSGHLPGHAAQPGLWPAFWVMGNLGRATLEASTDKIWPWSYSHCPDEEDKLANQDPLTNQEINACLGANWTAQYGLNPHQGRGAIELDIVEAMPGDFDIDYKIFKVDTGACAPLPEEEYAKLLSPRPMVATSLQLAPGMPFKADQRPMDSDAGDPFNCVPEDWSKQWYPELRPGTRATYGTAYQSTANVDFWGDYFNGTNIELQTDSLSSLNYLPHAVFEGQHVYRLDWKSGSDGYVEFSLDDKLQFRVNSSSAEREHEITRNGTRLGKLLGRQMPEEPSYLMLNIDLSTRWGFPDCQEDHCDCCTDCNDPKCTECYYPWDPHNNRRQWLADLCQLLPQHYDIDYVRVWQRPGNQRTKCSPKDYPTQGWIESHRDRYILPNMNEPLRPVFAGGFECLADSDCGGSVRGLCTDGYCRCKEAWTGPRCLAKKAGSAVTCTPLEKAAIGGAACYTTSSSACGAKKGRGKCVEVDRPGGIYAANQTNLRIDGTWEKSGGGDGRCACNVGWTGSSCTLPVDADQCLPDQYFPNPSWMGERLEAFIDDLCISSVVARNGQLAKACEDVLWKPHWIAGGEYAGCGSWLRALWVASAASCSRNSRVVVPVDTQLLMLIGGGVFVVFSLIGLCLTWMQRRRRLAKWGSPATQSSRAKCNASWSRAKHSRTPSCAPSTSISSDADVGTSKDTFDSGAFAGGDSRTMDIQGGLRRAGAADPGSKSSAASPTPEIRKVGFIV